MLKSFTVGLVILMLINNLLAFTAMRAIQLKENNPAPGEMIDIGGYRLHLYCEGQGNPVVIMEAGLGNPGMVWSLVQPKIATNTRVCVYDRAGLGWSDPGLRERTAEIMVDELHTLLQNSNVRAPYVLVGHSFGGLLMRLYTHTYPKEVLGIVLVDSYHYTQMEKYPDVHGKDNPLLSLSLTALDYWIASGIPSYAPSLVPVLDLGKLPAAQLETYRKLSAADSKFVKEAGAELAFLEESSQQERDAKIASVGNIPLIVLSHGYLEPRLLDPIGAAHHEEYETFWRADQKQLAALSPQGQLVIATKSGHYIQLDQPDLVIQAIQDVLLAVRANTTLSQQITD